MFSWNPYAKKKRNYKCLKFSLTLTLQTTCFRFGWWRYTLLIRPSSDGTYYGMVMSVRPSVRPFSALFLYMLWHNELKFCTWLCFNVLQIKFECRHFASIFIRPSGRIMVWWCPSVRPSGSPSARFPHFSPTCFDILSWNFAHDFVLMYYRSSSSVVNLRQFLWELCPFWNLNYWKYTVFALFSYMLWYIELKCCIWLCFTVLQIKFECRQFASIFVGVMPLLELKLLEIHSSPHFSLTCFDILSWNFAYDFVLLYYRSRFSVVNFRQFLWESCPFWNLKELGCFHIIFAQILTAHNFCLTRIKASILIYANALGYFLSIKVEFVMRNMISICLFCCIWEGGLKSATSRKLKRTNKTTYF